MKPVHPDHSAQRVDVHERLFETEPALHHKVEDADLRAREENPGDHEKDPGDDQRDDGEREEDRLERRIGPLVHPRERRAEHEGEERGAEREFDRVPEQPPGVAAAVGGGVVAEREDGFPRRRLRRAEALPEEEAERDDGKVDREGDRHADHDPLPVEGGLQRRRRHAAGARDFRGVTSGPWRGRGGDGVRPRDGDGGLHRAHGRARARDPDGRRVLPERADPR